MPMRKIKPPNELEGRVDDYLITSDGRKIGRLSTAIKRSPTIHSSQIVQDRPGHAYLLVRPGDGYQPRDAVAVHDDILERIGDLDLKVVEVSEIPKTPQGKTSLVVRLADRPHMRPCMRTSFSTEASFPTPAEFADKHLEAQCSVEPCSSRRRSAGDHFRP